VLLIKSQSQRGKPWGDDKPVLPTEMTDMEYRRMYRQSDPESQRPAQQNDGGWRSAADQMIPDTLSEFASAANRATAQGVDFLTTDPINNALSLAGSDKRIPTITQGIDAMGGQGPMAPGPAKETIRAAGSLLPAAAGMANVPRQAGTVTSTIADMVGAGNSALTNQARATTPYFQQMYDNIIPQNPLTAAKRQRVELPLKASNRNGRYVRLSP
jgi:hypothetical protein